ncbi:Maf family nucleotide pyrophosphatase [Flexibacterium corallicola]|uniref:Maf family nucleotide pyrophosphatase n=1 Tax=Flexibacterium corallicola TaxID=3037259 RepID=UPI00286F119B|nr:Maf family nucleotide pyrophosphatase [Pseudovibrio sp. M1P-2-3]
MGDKLPLILASASPRRLALLHQIGVEPDFLLPANIDESQTRAESPRALAQRLAREKAAAARAMVEKDPSRAAAIVLGADTVVAVGRRVLPKAETRQQASACLDLLSGRVHKVYTGVSVNTAEGLVRTKLIETRVRFRRLSSNDTRNYLASGEWRGKAGGYAIQGLAGSFIARLIGSYSNVVGLPLLETANLLAGLGYPVQEGWASMGIPVQSAEGETA